MVEGPDVWGLEVSIVGVYVGCRVTGSRRPDRYLLLSGPKFTVEVVGVRGKNAGTLVRDVVGTRSRGKILRLLTHTLMNRRG